MVPLNQWPAVILTEIAIVLSSLYGNTNSLFGFLTQKITSNLLQKNCLKIFGDHYTQSGE